MNAQLKEQPTKTIFCIELKGVTVGGVDWFWEPGKRAEQSTSDSSIWFDLDVPASATREEINSLADSAAWNKWYEDERLDCRLVERLELFNVTLDWEPGDDEQGDYSTSVWAINSDDAIRRVAEEMADSGQLSHGSAQERGSYIESVVAGASQFAAELVKDTVSADLANLLCDRPDALKAIKSILAGGPVNTETARVDDAAEAARAQIRVLRRALFNLIHATASVSTQKALKARPEAYDAYRDTLGDAEKQLVVAAALAHQRAAPEDHFLRKVEGLNTYEGAVEAFGLSLVYETLEAAGIAPH